MRPTRPESGDVALAAVLAVLGVVGTAGADRASGDVPVGLGGFALAVGAAAVLAVRRRWPLATLATAIVLTSTYLILGYPYGPILVSFFVAVYTVARHLPLSTAVPAALVALAVLVVHLFTSEAAAPGLLALVPASAWVVVPFAVGVIVRLNQEARASARAEVVRQRVYDERLHVAQEVHDVVGHGLAAIKMQAEVALHVLAKKPEQAETALQAISRTSAEALEELRATLSVVRQSGAEPSRSPAPGLHRLEDLRSRMSEAGVQVRLRTSGSPRDLPSAVDLAGYRVVQESLTNVLRHSDVKTATVGIGYGPDSVDIVVSSPAESIAAFSDGLGIPGMRQRVTSLGGTFSAGHTTDGRFEVRATLPTNGDSPLSNAGQP